MIIKPFSRASVPQVRQESVELANAICEVISEERLWHLADVHNRSNVLTKLISRNVGR